MASKDHVCLTAVCQILIFSWRVAWLTLQGLGLTTVGAAILELYALGSVAINFSRPMYSGAAVFGDRGS